MNLILFGDEEYLIQKYKNKYIKQILGDDPSSLNLLIFNFKTDDHKDILESLSNISLSFENKLIIIEDSDFLSLKTMEDDVNYLLKIIIELDEMTSVILLTNTKKLNKSNLIVDFISKNGEILEAKKLTYEEWHQFVKSKLEKEKIDYDSPVIDLIIERSNYNLRTFENEFKKIKNFGSKITKDVINLLIKEPLNENTFLILNNLLLNKKDLALKVYRDLLINNVEPTLLISMISTQMLFIDQVYYLAYIKKLDNYKIATMLHTNDKRIYMTKKNLMNTNKEKINEIFEKLLILDQNIKKGLVNRFEAFELFILNF